MKKLRNAGVPGIPSIGVSNEIIRGKRMSWTIYLNRLIDDEKSRYLSYFTPYTRGR